METYTYTPLNLDEPSFRLMRLFGGVGEQLQCELVHALLSPCDVMDYEAVSYTWGAITRSIFVIQIHGDTIKQLSIGPNLYHLLLDLRYPVEDRMLWIDAICINQDAQDASERNHQVQQMAEIYREAQRVLVWLGPPTPEMNIAMVSLIERQTLYNGMKRKAEEFRASQAWKGIQCSEKRDHDNPVCMGIRQILDQPWFRRIWILQEVGNARAALIHCGKKAVSSAIFSFTPWLFNVEVDPHCQAVLDLMPGSLARSTMGGPHRDLRTLLRSFRKAQATLEHDHIYALLGLCSEEDKSLRVSYEKPISTVISEVVSHICRFGVIGTLGPLYWSIPQFQADIDRLEETVLIRLASEKHTRDLRSIFERQGANITVTGNIIKAAFIRNGDCNYRPYWRIIEEMAPEIHKSTETLGIIIQRAESWAFAENVVEAAIRTKVSLNRIAQESVALVACVRDHIELLDIFMQRAEKSAITEAIVLEAISLENQYEELRNNILRKAERSVFNTSGVILAALLSKDLSLELFEFVLGRAGGVVITEEIVVAAIRNRGQKWKFLDAILQRAEISVINSKAVELAAISPHIKSREYLDIIYRRVGKLLITEWDVHHAFDHDEKHDLDEEGGGLVPFILERADRSLVNNETTLRAVVRQPAEKSMKFLALISERFGNLLVTEEILECARRADRRDNTDVRERYLLQHQLQVL
ncbi:heterokaryon incompatibility protein-domain-containing protein [Xylaria grammica]|nr:heterokaryon incompatibility protein-domain-containing protein [Xylaria grammica]